MKTHPSFPRPLMCICGLLFWAFATISQAADAGSQGPQAILHILDYVSVDYPGAVQNGAVKVQSEYAEQLEFVQRAQALVNQLPPNPQKAEISTQSAALVAAVQAKKSGEEIARLAGKIRDGLVQAYHVQVSPSRAPDLRAANTVYQNNCAACHGSQGFGNGPLSGKLDPKPANFHNFARFSQRSVYSLYNTISLGVEGTSMPSFSQLSEEDRWALAFLVSNFSAQPGQVEQGQALWQKGIGKDQFSSLEKVVNATLAETKATGSADAAAVLAYLRSNPAAVQQAKGSPLDISSRLLNDSVATYRVGDLTTAQQKAVDAYLEGFELAEASLDPVDHALRMKIETEMLKFRSQIKQRVPIDQLAAANEAIQADLKVAGERMASGTMSAGTSFTSALVILLREGLEAILVLAAVIAFLKKANRRDAMPYVHAGWALALALGGVTWFVASYFISISGANRELTEGVTAMVSVVMLLYVGFWLHSKMNAAKWKHFIEHRVTNALSGTLWTMAAVSFLAVYREVFEVVLFYQTLWVEAGPIGHAPILWGFAAAMLSLVVVAWLIMRFSVRLPLKLFFGVSSWLMALLAVVFAGQGVAALQEAGKLPIDSLPIPSIPMLGIYPNSQGLIFQVVVLAIVIAGFAYASRGGRPAGQVSKARG